MDKKKETSNIVIYLCMILLLVVIILPPVLRAFIPKDEEVETTKGNEKIVLLTCRLKSTDGTYQVNSKTKFMEKEAQSVTLAYKKLEPSTTPTPSVAPEATTPPVEETTPTASLTTITDPDISWLRELEDAEISEESDQFSIVLTKKTLASNPNVQALNGYFSDFSTQKKYYETLGYTCTKLES